VNLHGPMFSLLEVGSPPMPARFFYCGIRARPDCCAALTLWRDDLSESHDAVTGAGLKSLSRNHGDAHSLSAWLRRRSAAACVGAGALMRS
jgi:hypothetical protein